MGGLTAAAHLVKAGLRVLVPGEKPPQSWDGYVYQPGRDSRLPHGPPFRVSGHPGLVQNTLKDLGLEKSCKFSRVHYRIRAFDLDLPL